MKVTVEFTDRTENRDISPTRMSADVLEALERGETVTIRAAAPALQPGMVVRVVADENRDGDWIGRLGTVTAVHPSGTLDCAMWDGGGSLDVLFYAGELEQVIHWPHTAKEQP
ncbi:MAG: hypothetical protein GEU89_21395 [Kiloniellaceae bacterium]|nr:hypothetical protein [Kiloniellaceae bacterium]